MDALVPKLLLALVDLRLDLGRREAPALQHLVRHAAGVIKKHALHVAPGLFDPRVLVPPVHWPRDLVLLDVGDCDTSRPFMSVTKQMSPERVVSSEKLTAGVDEPFLVVPRDLDIPAHGRGALDQHLPSALGDGALGAEEQRARVVELDPSAGREAVVGVLYDGLGAVETCCD